MKIKIFAIVASLSAVISLNAVKANAEIPNTPAEQEMLKKASEEAKDRQIKNEDAASREFIEKEFKKLGEQIDEIAKSTKYGERRKTKKLVEFKTAPALNADTKAESDVITADEYRRQALR